jgi:hypothetical protein
MAAANAEGKSEAKDPGEGFAGCRQHHARPCTGIVLNAVVFNADAVRANLSRDLGFSHANRIEHARRMGWTCDRAKVRALSEAP